MYVCMYVCMCIYIEGERDYSYTHILIYAYNHIYIYTYRDNSCLYHLTGSVRFGS